MLFQQSNLRKIFSPRVFAGIIGLILITAAALKSSNIQLFIREIMAYQIIDNPLMLTFGAWGLIITEFALGTSLLIYYRPRVAISLTGILFAVFLGAVTWALITGVTEDCGCFGSWAKRSPAGAIIEDLVMVGVLALAWPRRKQPESAGSRIKPFIVMLALITGIVLPICFGAPVKELFAIGNGKAKAEENLFALQELAGVDLKNGSFLFVVFSTDCSHCRDSVEEFNRIARKTDLPRVIALSSDSEDQRASFIQELKPVFPVMGITEDGFYRLLGTGFTPRSILVVKQHVLKTWDEEAPGVEAINEALGKNKTPP
jgi:hypothetical protein